MKRLWIKECALAHSRALGAGVDGCLGNHLPLRRVRILAERFYRMETKFPIR